jgi:hypothetical protein
MRISYCQPSISPATTQMLSGLLYQEVHIVIFGLANTVLDQELIASDSDWVLDEKLLRKESTRLAASARYCSFCSQIRCK